MTEAPPANRFHSTSAVSDGERINKQMSEHFYLVMTTLKSNRVRLTTVISSHRHRQLR